MQCSWSTTSNRIISEACYIQCVATFATEGNINKHVASEIKQGRHYYRPLRCICGWCQCKQNVVMLKNWVSRGLQLVSRHGTETIITFMRKILCSFADDFPLNVYPASNHKCSNNFTATAKISVAMIDITKFI